MFIGLQLISGGVSDSNICFLGRVSAGPRGPASRTPSWIGAGLTACGRGRKDWDSDPGRTTLPQHEQRVPVLADDLAPRVGRGSATPESMVGGVRVACEDKALFGESEEVEEEPVLAAAK